MGQSQTHLMKRLMLKLLRRPTTGPKFSLRAFHWQNLRSMSKECISLPKYLSIQNMIRESLLDSKSAGLLVISICIKTNKIIVWTTQSILGLQNHNFSLSTLIRPYSVCTFIRISSRLQLHVELFLGLLTQKPLKGDKNVACFNQPNSYQDLCFIKTQGSLLMRFNSKRISIFTIALQTCMYGYFTNAYGTFPRTSLLSN